MLADWDVSGEDVGDRHLWEDNWDDDNMEDDFSCQLRCSVYVRRRKSMRRSCHHPLDLHCI